MRWEKSQELEYHKSIQRDPTPHSFFHNREKRERRKNIKILLPLHEHTSNSNSNFSTKQLVFKPIAHTKKIKSHSRSDESKITYLQIEASNNNWKQ
jgi:hypothetical protein